MKYYLGLFLSFLMYTSYSQKDSTPILKSILLEQLNTTHNVKDWFVPLTIAIADLTATQANWKDGTGNHSIAELTTHLIFWNKQLLDKFKGLKPDTFNGNNKETFSEVTESSWKQIVQKLDGVLTDWEIAVKTADEKKLKTCILTLRILVRIMPIIPDRSYTLGR